jgi:K+-transporting ATPase ATPase A chain
MVGRTPEYIGKKIRRKELTMALLAILVTAFLILIGAAWTRSRILVALHTEGRSLGLFGEPSTSRWTPSSRVSERAFW